METETLGLDFWVKLRFVRFWVFFLYFYFFCENSNIFFSFLFLMVVRILSVDNWWMIMMLYFFPLDLRLYWADKGLL